MSEHNLQPSLNGSKSLYLEVTSLLARSETYPERPKQIDHVETHISSVFLTDKFVYKLKKPVKFEFLDFSSAERRRAACNEEVRINRRLARDVYLGVLPITRNATGGLQLAGDGTVVDWVVKMRRLPESQSLDSLIAHHQVQSVNIEALTHRLIDFYQHSPPLGVKTDEYRREIEQHLLANRSELMRPEYGLDISCVKRVHTAQLRLLRICPELLDSRVCDGRIVDGHGDLRPEHIYFAPDPVVIDGIEFNSEFRRLDVLDELSFLAMECSACGAAELGNEIVSEYCDAANDHPPVALIRFYETYRACVRAKVAALRSRQLDGDDRRMALATAARYLNIADRFAAELGSPMVLMVWGLSGTGKSVVAEELASQLGCQLIQTDAVRREMFGASEKAIPFNADQYSLANRNVVYEEVFRRAESFLAQKVSVVLDGTFLDAEQRTRAAAYSHRDDVQFLSVRCDCPDEVALERIHKRLEAGNSLSEFRPDLFSQQRRLLERSCVELPGCTIDTTECLPEMVKRVFSHLHGMFFPSLSHVELGV